MNKLLLLWICFPLFLFSQNFNQLGQDIDGEASGDQSGSAVSVSSDGRIVAIGAFANDGNLGIGSNTGHVRVYENILGIWSQIGQDIDGEAASDYSGWSVSLSANGHIVAIGAENADGNNANSGHVRVYSYDINTDTWNQLGADIDGDETSDSFGCSVSLSSDGNTVAIGAEGYDNGASSNYSYGLVRVYNWSGSTWNQKGADILPSDPSDKFNGKSVSLSYSGDTLAVGITFGGAINGACGLVRVYYWNSSSWAQLGTDISEGTQNYQDLFGYSVSLSSDGATVAIGAPHEGLTNFYGSSLSQLPDGAIYVYSWNSSSWTQVGSEIRGDNAGDETGTSVSISSDGQRVATNFKDIVGANTGYVRVYEFNSPGAPWGQIWTQIGIDINGEATNDHFYGSISLSADGGTVIIGSGYNNGYFGHVRAFCRNTITHTSGMTTQSMCINTAITNILYSTTGATGATFSGLPPGVTGSWSGNTVTISGVPTTSGIFNFTVATTGGGIPETLSGIITVSPLHSITSGTNQTVCINTPISNISLPTTGATGAIFSGLPPGVTGSWSGDTVTISGAPTTSGIFNYTVTTTGGVCPLAITTGTITVTPSSTITSGTNQTICINTPITSISLSTTGATGATFSGLPPGVIGSWSGNTVTISGVPTTSGTFNYTVTTTGAVCPLGTATSTGTITVLSLNTSASIILGNTQVNNLSTETYNAAQNNNSTYNWYLDNGGIIISGLNTNSIQIQWGNNSGIYNLFLIESDINGCIGDTLFLSVNVLSTTNVSELNIEKLTVYPNPSKDVFNIDFVSLSSQDIELKILNSIGDLVYIDNLNNHIGQYSNSISLKEYPKAIYFLEIQTEDGIVNKKLILQ